MRQRDAQPGEYCTCGRPAVIVFFTDDMEAIGWCGTSDGGASGPCRFCGGDKHMFGRCPNYQLRFKGDESK